jgi:AbrB family looped-hinge helix DNA binding protein
MMTTTLTSKGQITIPKAVRDALHLACGDRVEFHVQNDSEALVRAVNTSVDQMFGRLRRPGQKAMSVAAMDQALRRRTQARQS